MKTRAFQVYDSAAMPGASKRAIRIEEPPDERIVAPAGE
jgi:hypothetical protein